MGKAGMKKSKHPIWTKAAKEFNNKTFFGNIVAVDYEMKWYHVRYEDDDEEHINMIEIDIYVVNEQIVRYIGKKVNKELDGKDFYGEVISIDFREKYFKVLYSD